MPSAAPRLCSCGYKIASGERCPCQHRRDQERNRIYEGTRPNASARGYDAAWRRARLEHLAKNPCCVKCANPATVVDHILPHKGNMRLFWNRANWQSLCKPHHDSWKQSQEKQ